MAIRPVRTRQTKWRLDKVERKVRKNVQRAIATAIFEVRDEIVRLLTLGGPGPPSPPGRPPHTQSGQLHQSVQPDISGLAAKNPKATVGPGVPYSATHELGLGKFPKRPYMAPALKNMRPRIAEIFKAANITKGITVQGPKRGRR